MKTSTAQRLEWPARTTVTVPEVAPEPQDLAECLGGPNGQELVVEMAHDLRSPLTAILFLAESLQNAENGPVTDSQRRQLGLIYSAALGLCATASDRSEERRVGKEGRCRRGRRQRERKKRENGGEGIVTIS